MTGTGFGRGALLTAACLCQDIERVADRSAEPAQDLRRFAPQDTFQRGGAIRAQTEALSC